MRFIKKSLVLVLPVLLVAFATIGFVTFSPPTRTNSSVEASTVSQGWNHVGSSSTQFSVNANNLFTISSFNYDIVRFEKTFAVSQNSNYRFSVDVWTNAVVLDGTFEPMQRPAEIYEVDALADPTGTNYRSSLLHKPYDSTKGGWQTLFFTFNTGTRNQMTLCMGQGFTRSPARGTSQFRNLKLELITETTDTHWNFLCVIPKIISVKNISNFTGGHIGSSSSSVVVPGTTRDVTVTMSAIDIALAKAVFQSFEQRINLMGNGLFTASVDIVVVEQPVTSVSRAFDGYWVGPRDIYPHIKSTMEQKVYDHVMILPKFSEFDAFGNAIDQLSKYIPIAAAGLGGVRIDNPRGDSNNFTGYSLGYFFHSWQNGSTYPNVSVKPYSEVLFVHEFLHSMEGLSPKMGFGITNPPLHSAGEWGYEPNDVVGSGWHDFYVDFIRRQITYQGNHLAINGPNNFGLPTPTGLLPQVWNRLRGDIYETVYELLSGYQGWSSTSSVSGGTSFEVSLANVLTIQTSPSIWANTSFEKTFIVQPNSRYKFTVDVFAEYATGQSPSMTAAIHELGQPVAAYNPTKGGWQTLSVEIYTTDYQYQTTLCMSLGFNYTVLARGTASFKNIKLENISANNTKFMTEYELLSGYKGWNGFLVNNPGGWPFNTEFNVLTGNVFSITSSQFSLSRFEKTFAVDWNTRYRFTVDVYAQGTTGELSWAPAVIYELSGLGGHITSGYNPYQVGWQTLEIEFETWTRTEITLCMGQGWMGTLAKGTTLFKNIKLQNMSTSKIEYSL